MDSEEMCPFFYTLSLCVTCKVSVRLSGQKEDMALILSYTQKANYCFKWPEQLNINQRSPEGNKRTKQQNIQVDLMWDSPLYTTG